MSSGTEEVLMGVEAWREAARKLKSEESRVDRSHSSGTGSSRAGKVDEAVLAGPSEPACVKLPFERYRLEEINLADEIIDPLLGRTVAVEVSSEAMPSLYQIGRAQGPPPPGVPLLIDKQGRTWIDRWVMRVVYRDEHNRLWRFPRYWLTDGCDKYKDESRYDFAALTTWVERLHMPSWWDLRDVNIGSDSALEVHGDPSSVEVRAAPNSPVQVFWKDASGASWRIPCNWRRRRVKLPSATTLMSNGVPSHVAEEFEGRAVSVNYHLGSICCLPDGYRFRDNVGDRWEVAMADCLLLGYGDQDESLG